MGREFQDERRRVACKGFCLSARDARVVSPYCTISLVALTEYEFSEPNSICQGFRENFTLHLWWEMV